MITTVLFDMGGTLEDISYSPETAKLACETAYRILSESGYLPPVSVEPFQKQLEEGIRRYKRWSESTQLEKKPEEIWPQFYLSDWKFPSDIPASFWEELAGMWEVTFYRRKLRPGVQETLQSLQSLGLKLGVISNTASLYSVFDVLEAYKIRSFMQCITLSSVTGYRKPHPGIFEIALREIHSQACETVYVGDTRSRDILGAESAGLFAGIQIPSFLTSEKDPSKAKLPEARYQIRQIPDLIPLIQPLLH